MKKYRITWETDYCDNFPETSGESVIAAESEEEAIKEFKGNILSKAIILDVSEVLEERK